MGWRRTKPVYAQEVVVAKSGGRYNEPQSAIDSITDNGTPTSVPTEFRKVWGYDTTTPTWTDETMNANYPDSSSSADLALGTYLGQDVGSNYIYIGSDEPFNKLTFNMGSVVNANAATIKVELVSNNDPLSFAAVSNLSDGTASPVGTPFAQGGDLAWDMPSPISWDKTTLNGSIALFYIRISVTDNVITAGTLVQYMNRYIAKRYLVKIAPGTWNLSAQISMKSYVSLQGSGRSATVLVWGGAGGVIAPANEVVISDMKLFGNGLKNASAGISNIGVVGNSITYYVENCSIVSSGDLIYDSSGGNTIYVYNLEAVSQEDGFVIFHILGANNPTKMFIYNPKITLANTSYAMAGTFVAGGPGDEINVYGGSVGGYITAANDTNEDIGATSQGTLRLYNVHIKYTSAGIRTASMKGIQASNGKAEIYGGDISITVASGQAYDLYQSGSGSIKVAGTKYSTSFGTINPMQGLKEAGIRAATQTLAASDSIALNGDILPVAGSGGAVTLTSNPSIADGVTGQEIIIEGTSDTNTLTLTDATLGMQLAGDITLGLYDTIRLYYNGTDWIEISRSNN